MLQLQRERLPVVKVVEITAPIVVKADVSNFRSLVQQLTGREDCNLQANPSPSAFCERMLKRRKISNFGSESDHIRGIVSSLDLTDTGERVSPDDLVFLQPSVSLSEPEIEKKSFQENALSPDFDNKGSRRETIEHYDMGAACEQGSEAMSDLNSMGGLQGFSDFEHEEVATGLLLEGMEELAGLLFPESCIGSIMWAP